MLRGSGRREELRKFLVRNYTGISWALGKSGFLLDGRIRISRNFFI